VLLIIIPIRKERVPGMASRPQGSKKARPQSEADRGKNVTRKLEDTRESLVLLAAALPRGDKSQFNPVHTQAAEVSQCHS
jgi:hypothetical protein